MSMTADNPRAVIGSNEAPDYAKIVTDQMLRDYAEYPGTVAATIAEANTLPEKIDDDEQMGAAAKLIKRLRDLTSRMDAFRIKETEPHLRGQQAVNGFFFGLIDKCARRDRKAQPGAADVLQARLDDYNQRKLAAEQAARRRAAEEAARVEREALENAARERAAAEEARLAAERARKPEIVEAKGVAAEQQEAVADAARVEHSVAAGKAEDAYIATLAKPADLIRTRVESGPLVTMATEPYAIVVDRNKLDYVKLAPFFSMDAVEKALRAWSKNTGHTQMMDGASIGKKPKSVVR